MVSLQLFSPTGGIICGKECGLLGNAERTTFTAQINVVPQITGPGLPITAVRTNARGGSYVVLGNGDLVPIRILASNNGLAVVDGLETGIDVVLFELPLLNHTQ